MSILRDETLVAINDLIVACRESANLLRTGADALNDHPAGRGLRDLADKRTSDADDLAAVVAKMEDVANAPNEEKELLTSAVTRLKAALSADEVVQILRDCKRCENGVAESAESLLALEVEEALGRVARRLIEESRTDIPRIAAAAGIRLDAAS